MKRRLRDLLDHLIRLILVLGLACSPLAQPMALAALAAPPPENAGGCPHHAKTDRHTGDSPTAKAGECRHKKGAPCHCAMTVALPSAGAPAFDTPASDHPESVPHLAASILPAPEPPPPRA